MTAPALQHEIEALWEQRETLSSATKGAPRKAVEAALALLGDGSGRVAERGNDGWRVHQWLKQAVLLSFRLNDSMPMEGAGGAPVFDKVAMKFEGWDAARFQAAGFRAVPGAVVRQSAYIAPGVVLMPSFVNVGAYVDREHHGRYLDHGRKLRANRQATAICQRRRRHRRRAGAVAGGNPVVIEDDCFVGARSEVAEGVIVERGSVLAMGVFLGASTKVIDRNTGEVHLGRVPAYSVVIPGALPGKPLPDGSPGPGLSCAVIAKRVDAGTRAKTSINELLRD